MYVCACVGAWVSGCLCEGDWVSVWVGGCVGVCLGLRAWIYLPVADN